VEDDARASLPYFQSSLQLAESTPVRSGLARAHVELHEFDEAARVLERVTEPDEEVAEVWEELLLAQNRALEDVAADELE
jgi:hypothetical protein